MKASTIDSIACALNGAGVPFLVVGGLAVVAHGYGRQTQDLDLVVPVDADTVGRLFAALATLGYAPRVAVTASDVTELQRLHGGHDA